MCGVIACAAFLAIGPKNTFEKMLYPNQDRKWICNVRKEGRMYFTRFFALLSTPVILVVFTKTHTVESAAPQIWNCFILPHELTN